MFANRAFNIALLISILWHLICISAVNIVSLPGKFRFGELTSISFLGPILEKTALDIMMANRPVAVRTNYEGGAAIRPEIRTERNDTLLTRERMKQDIAKRSEKNMGKAVGVYFQETKEVPALARSLNRPKRPAAIKEGEISWPAASREVFYKPDKPNVPESVSSNMPFNMEFNFLVSAQGDVKEVVPVISSGNAEVDLLGIRYLKSWKFGSLRSEAVQKEEWGRAKIVLSKE